MQMSVSVVIPAYNEECRVANVINAVKKAKGIDEIIVVSDGSKDKTASVARLCGANVIEFTENMGKGAAVKAGTECCNGDIVLFLDADLIGLNETHIEKLIHPVISREADMSIGVFAKGRISTDIAQKISPCLSGQRAVRKNILNNVGNLDVTGYGIEMALTKYVQKHNLQVKEVELQDVTHIMKEEKLGLARGFYQRLRMYWQIYKGFRLAKRY